MAQPFPRRAARGMTPVELMVAMLVMTIGIVGLVALMARASQAAAGAAMTTGGAALLAADLANDMWVYNSTNPPTQTAPGRRARRDAGPIRAQRRDRHRDISRTERCADHDRPGRPPAPRT